MTTDSKWIEDKTQLNLSCPECGCCRVRILDKRDRRRSVWRRCICLHCAHVYTASNHAGHAGSAENAPSTRY